jgi:hypothetical protein
LRAVHAANRGLIDADLGGGVIKQRIARRGSGKSDGFRTLVVFQILDRAISLPVALKKLAIDLLGYREADLEASIRSGTLTELNCDGKYETVSQQSNGVHS